MLASFSEYFRGMFSAGTKESTQKEALLPSVDSETMKELLGYIYSGEITLTSDNIYKIAIAANFFGSEQLVEECGVVMSRLMDHENCVKMLEFADKYNFRKLKDNASSYVLDHLEKIHRSNLDFFSLPLHLLIELIQSDKAVLVDNDPEENEKYLFALLMNNVSRLPEEKRFIKKILLAIRLPCVSPDYMNYIERKVGHMHEVKELIEIAKRLAIKKKAFTPKGERLHVWSIARSKSSITVSIRTSLTDLKQRGKLASSVGCLNGNRVAFFLQWCEGKPLTYCH